MLFNGAEIVLPDNHTDPIPSSAIDHVFRNERGVHFRLAKRTFEDRLRARGWLYHLDDASWHPSRFLKGPKK